MDMTATKTSESSFDGRKAASLAATERLCAMINNEEGELDDGVNCEECKNRGFFMVPLDRGSFWSEKMVSCKCWKKRRALARMKASGLGDDLESKTFATFRATESWQQAIIRAAKDYAEDPTNGWFFIGGQSGCGKSHICTAICGELIEKNRDVRYMEWVVEVADIKALACDSEERMTALNKLKNADVLYIDDLFKAKRGAEPSDADIRLAFEIIDYRYRKKDRPTIISSEYSIRELLTIDEATAGRIFEKATAAHCGFAIAKDPKKNYRTRGIQQF